MSKFFNHRAWHREGAFRSFDHQFDDGRVFTFNPTVHRGAVLTFVDVTPERKLADIAERREGLTREADVILDKVARLAAEHRLVALKASIEAARLGEEGRSFAVVADEVRELSRQATDMLADVRRLIQASLNTN